MSTQRKKSYCRERIQQLRSWFKRHLMKKLRMACKLSGDPLGGICDLVEVLGVDYVLRLLVAPDEVHNPPAGFVRLMDSDLARYTIEQAIIDFEDSGLFAKLEIETARERIAVYSRRGQRFT